MFSRINNSQPKDTKVQEEISTEDKFIQSIGNEASQNIPPVLPNTGNQAVNNQIKDLYTEKNLQGPEIIGDASLSGMDLSDEIDDPNIISTGTKPKKIRKPEVVAEENPDISASGYGIDPDMVPQRPKRKKEKEREKQLKKQKKNNYLTAEENADEALALVRGRMLKEEMIRKVQKEPMPEEEKNAEMEKIKSWNFRSQRLERVIEKPGAGNKFLSFLGWAVGSLLSLPVSPVMYIASYITSLFGDKAKMQKKRKHKMIPGWDGKTFDTEASGEEILADFRRIPTVWSYLTAD